MTESQQTPQLDTFTLFEPGAGGLTAFELDAVVSYAAEIADTATPGVVGSGHERPDIRRATVAWLFHSARNEWLFSRVWSLAHVANHALGWNFDLSGPRRAIQISAYDASQLGGFEWHLDIGPADSAARKISVAIELESAVEGGVLQFRPGPEPSSIVPSAGAATVFPAYLPHRVTPVTVGRRLSLVAWICGPPFR